MELTINDLRALISSGTGTVAQTQSVCPVSPGDNVFICTVTKFFTGRVESVAGGFIELSGAAWIADTGRLSEALADADKFNEVEMYTRNVYVAIHAIVDITRISTLPQVTK